MWKFGVVEKGERRFFNGLKKKVKQIEIERILILLLQVYNTGQWLDMWESQAFDLHMHIKLRKHISWKTLEQCKGL